MKRILLISNYVFHYRIKIYNYFYDEFKKVGYEFHVLSNEYQNVNYDIKFKKHQLNFSISGYIKKINEIKPDIVINFLHLKDKLIIPLTYHCKLKRIPMIYWNHGIDLNTPNAKIKNSIYRYIHKISDAIILYTPNELKYISNKNKSKTFIAYNTLCLLNEEKKDVLNKEEVKNKYNIKEQNILMYISRIKSYKKLDVLLDNFSGLNNIGVVIVGSGINEAQLQKVNNSNNIYYLGEKYDKEVDEIYNMGDIFSTPGHIGLALNQSLFWGKPVVLLEGRHAPEIYYMKNGINGYLAKDELEFKTLILELFKDDDKLNRLSNNAKEIFKKEASIEKMFSGFIEAIKYCENK